MEYRAWQPAQGTNEKMPPPRKGGPDPYRDDVEWGAAGSPALLQIPGAHPICTARPRDGDQNHLRSLLRKRQEWSVKELIQQVQWDLLVYAGKRADDRPESSITYIAFSNCIINRGRVPIHNQSYRDIQK